MVSVRKILPFVRKCKACSSDYSSSYEIFTLPEHCLSDCETWLMYCVRVCDRIGDFRRKATRNITFSLL